MKHPDKTELENFIAGRLTADRTLQVDEHVSSCDECRQAVMGSAQVKKTALDMGTALLGVYDCPEYEQLSAYVDNELDQVHAREIAAHVNFCDICTRDVSRIAELRSHAAMRQTVRVSPGMSTERAARVSTPIWKRILAGSAAAAVLVGLTVVFSSMIETPSETPGTSVAKVEKPKGEIQAKTGIPESDKTAGDTASNGDRESATGLENTPKPPTVIETTEPDQVNDMVAETEVLLKDGDYEVTQRDGRMVLAKTGAGAPRTAVEARIAAAIDEKLKSGKIKLDKPVELAMAELRVRATSPFQPSPLAPKLVSPAGKIVISDRPTLTWTAAENADSYRVTVYDGAGYEVLSEVTDKNSLTVRAPMKRGQVYSWLVQVRFAESDEWDEVTTPASAPAKFKVLAEDEYACIRRVQQSAPGSHLALGAAYEAFGLKTEAEREYAALKAANPDADLIEKLR